MLMALVVFVVGMVLLVVGADAFVRGAAALARKLGLSPLVIGLTVVAFGTSAPEVGVSVSAALAGQSDMAIGNVVGSNIFNILLILGMSAVIAPLIVSRQLIRLDVPLMAGASVLLWWLARDGAISRAEGALLFGLLIVWTVSTVILGRVELDEVEELLESPFRPSRDLPLLVGGLGGLLVGSQLAVDGAVRMAQILGVSEVIIGLTVVSAGTSLPEAATSIVAALRGQRDIAVGNIVGSNLFNVLCVVGLTGLVAAPLTVDEVILVRDLPVNLIAAVLCLPIFWTGLQITRPEGTVFLLGYVLYMAELAMEIRDPGFRQYLPAIFLYGWVPFAALVLAWVMVRHLRRHGLRAPPVSDGEASSLEAENGQGVSPSAVETKDDGISDT